MADRPARGRDPRHRRRGRARPAAAPALSSTAPLPLVAGVRARLTPATALAATACLSPVMAGLVLAFSSGGYFIRDWGVASIVLLALLAVAVLTLDVSLGGRWGALALGGLVGLGGWQGISSAWAFQPSAAITAMNQTLLYAAAFALVLVGVRRVADLNVLMWGALAGSAIVTAYALASRLLPALVSGDEQTRLSTPITYWNGLGALVAFGALLALGLATHPWLPRWARAAAAGLAPMFLLALLLTYSRGAAATLAIGVGVLLALAPGRLETVAGTALTLAVSVPLLLAANGEEAIAAITGVLPPHEDEGRRILLFLIATMIASAVVCAGSSLLLSRLSRGQRRVSGIAVTACALAGIVAALATATPDAGPVGWTKQQFTSFKTFDTGARAEAESVSDRLAVAAGSGRWQNWSVAADEFRESPVVGTGAGDYVFFWQQNRDVDLTVTNAHSVYLEVLAETGLVGLLLLLLPAGAIGAAFVAHRRRRPEGAPSRSVAVALSATVLIGVHAAGDWDWQIPTIVLPAIALAAGAVKVMSLRDPAGPAAPLTARAGLALGAILAIALVAGPTVSATALSNAHRSASDGDLERALGLSRDAAALSPADPAPRLLEANLLSDLGRPGQADAAFAAAVARSARDWQIFADWATHLARRGDTRAARSAALRARALNPMEQRPALILEGLTP